MFVRINIFQCSWSSQATLEESGEMWKSITRSFYCFHTQPTFFLLKLIQNTSGRHIQSHFSKLKLNFIYIKYHIFWGAFLSM